jgi:hypothetical protein
MVQLVHCIYNKRSQTNLAEVLSGKKVLVGGIEGLSRFVYKSKDKNALQLFGNGAGIIGVIPGETMQFLVGKTHEVFDEQGVLAVHMYYPHSRQRIAGQSLVEITQDDENHIRFAGLMNEPKSGAPVEMAGNMGMVKLFVVTALRLCGMYTRLIARKCPKLAQSVNRSRLPLCTMRISR